MIKESINFHAKTGVKIVYDFTNEDGTERDMTGETVKLYVSNGFCKPLTIDPADSSKMILLLRGSEVPSIVGKRAAYVVIDESNEPGVEVAGGGLVVTGWL
jgi:hypothetical protein